MVAAASRETLRARPARVDYLRGQGLAPRPRRQSCPASVPTSRWVGFAGFTGHDEDTVVTPVRDVGAAMTTPIATGQPLGPDPSDPAMSRRSLAVAMIAAGLVVTAPTAAQAQKTSHSGPRAAVLLELSYSQQLARFVRTVSDPASKRYRRLSRRRAARRPVWAHACRAAVDAAVGERPRTAYRDQPIRRVRQGHRRRHGAAKRVRRAACPHREQRAHRAQRPARRRARGGVRRPASSRAKAAPRSPEPRLNPMSAAGASLAPGGPPSIAAALTRCGAAAVLPCRANELVAGIRAGGKHPSYWTEPFF